MLMHVFHSSSTGKTQAGGAFTVTIAGNDYKPYQRATVQVTVEPGTATTGSVAITVSPYLTSSFEPVYDDAGSALAVSLADMETVEFSCALSDIQFTPSAADGTYNVYVTVWQEQEVAKL